MPYIEKAERDKLIRNTDGLKFSEMSDWWYLVNSPETTGELNFIITKVCHDIIRKHGLCYAVINDLIGVLECCKLELYRKIAAPYEQKKLMENGPISDLDSKSLEDVR